MKNAQMYNNFLIRTLSDGTYRVVFEYKSVYYPSLESAKSAIDMVVAEIKKGF